MIEPVAKSAISGEPLYECQHCKAWKLSSQLRVLYGEPICIFCWDQIYDEFRWHSLEIIESYGKTYTCEHCKRETRQLHDYDGDLLCIICWSDRVIGWYDDVRKKLPQEQP